MKSIKVISLTLENFIKYGSYHSMINPETERLGPPPVEFYRDICRVSLGQNTTAALSVTRVSPRPLVIEKFEYHNLTGEAFMPIDGNIFVHLAPAGKSSVIPYDKIKVFRIPKGVMVTIHPGVWHQAPFAAGQDIINVLNILPERTYENDCHMVLLPEKEKLSIEE